MNLYSDTVKTGKMPMQGYYPLVFLPDSQVFHRCGCRLISGKRTRGTSYFREATEGRRPCKICNPTADDGIDSIPIEPAEERKPVPVKRDGTCREPVKPVPEGVQMMTGEVMNISRKKMVGTCTYALHPGGMTYEMMLEHDCISKGCPYFKKNTFASIWNRKDVGKEEKKIAKQREKSFEEELGSIRDDLQDIADRGGYRLEIVRVEKVTYWRIKVFYVSDNRFGDGKIFRPYLDRILEAYPQLSIDFRHIKDVDGHFVTTEEYRNRRRK